MDNKEKIAYYRNLAIALRTIGLQVTQEDAVLISNVVMLINGNKDAKVSDLYDVAEQSKKEIEEIMKIG
jgi:hypothetical protein